MGEFNLWVQDRLSQTWSRWEGSARAPGCAGHAGSASGQQAWMGTRWRLEGFYEWAGVTPPQRKHPLRCPSPFHPRRPHREAGDPTEPRGPGLPAPAAAPPGLTLQTDVACVIIRVCIWHTTVRTSHEHEIKFLFHLFLHTGWVLFNNSTAHAFISH